MVRAHDFRENFGGFDPRPELGAHKKIIYAPADVPRPRIGKVRPPRIMAAPLFKNSKSIDEPGLDYFVYSLSLLLCKAMLALVLLGPRQVVRRVRSIQITAKYHRFLFFKLLAISKKGRVPKFVPQLQSAQIRFRIRRVNIDHVKIIKLGGDNPPLAVRVPIAVFRKFKFFQDFLWQAEQNVLLLFFRENGGAAITFARGRIPVFLVLWEVHLRLPRFGLGFLQA